MPESGAPRGSRPLVGLGTGHRQALPLLAGVVAEGRCGRELAQLVTHHGLGHVDGHVTAAVVHGDGCPTMSGMIVDRRDQVLMTLLSPLELENVHLLQQVVVDEWGLLQATRHASSPLA